MPNNKTYLVELNEKEACLIVALRTRFRFKEVTIMMRDGIPQFIVQAWISDNLEKLDEKHLTNNKK